MKFDERGDNEPLPFIKLDRTFRAKASALSEPLGVSWQHVTGAMGFFWELCGEPRVLEQLLAKGVREIVLPRDTVARRLRLAFGKDIAPEVLVDAGLLEPRDGDTFRVKGMSRFFDVIEARLLARDKGARGGRASAAARRGKGGSAQPARTNTGRSGSRSESAAPSAQPQLKQMVEQVVEPARSSTEAPGQPDGAAGSKPNQPEDRGQRTEASKDLLLQARAVENYSLGEAFARRAQDRRIELGYVEERPDEYAKGLGAWFSEALMKLNGDDLRLWQAFEEFLLDAYWVERKCPFAAFKKRWESWVPKKLRHVDRPTEDTPEARAWASKLTELTNSGHGYEASKLAALTSLGLDGDRLVVESADPYFANWCRTVAAELPLLANVSVVVGEAAP